MALRTEFKSLALKQKADDLTQLIKKRTEILRCIDLIKKGMHKRNRSIRITMLLTMAGTAIGAAIYFIYKYNHYIIQSNEFNEMNLQFRAELTNQLSSVESSFNQLNSLVPQLKKNISDAQFNVSFYRNNDSDWGHGPISLSCAGSCDTRFTGVTYYFDYQSRQLLPRQNSYDFHCTHITHHNPLYTFKYLHPHISSPSPAPLYTLEDGSAPSLPAKELRIGNDIVPFTPSCGVVGLAKASILAYVQIPSRGCASSYIWPTEVHATSNIIDPCPNLIENFCHTNASLLATNSTLNKIRNRIIDPEFYVSFYNSFQESLGEMAVFYLMTCGLGEIAPTIVIMLTLLTHVFTKCFASGRCRLSYADEILDTADEYDIKLDNTSYPKMLKQFEGELLANEARMEPLEKRMAFCRASRMTPVETPLSLLFNHPNLREPKLANIIFHMAALTKDSKILNESMNHRRVFQLGMKHDNGRVDSLHEFFKALKNQAARGEGANSAKAIKEIYQFAGFVS